jgi:hypothetical protein
MSEQTKVGAISELLRYTRIEAPARAELRREYTNATAITKFVNLVKQIYDIKP